MTAPVVYVNRFTIADGKVDDLRRYCQEMTQLVQDKEPETISFSFFVDEDQRTGTAVFVFESAEALDFHFDVASHKFQEAAGLFSATDIELLGPASEQVQRVSKDHGAKIKSGVIAGFVRSPR